MKKSLRNRLTAGTLCTMMVATAAACGSASAVSETKTAETTKAAAATEAPKATVATTEAPKEAEPQALRVLWWGNQTRADSTSAVLNLFAEQNPGVTVEVEFTDWKGYWDKLSTLAISNNMPDIIQMDVSYLAQYSEKGLLESLDSYLESGTIDVSDVSEKTIELGAYKDSVYAIPTGTNVRALAYRPDVVKEAGVEIPMAMTWSEYFEIAKTVYEKTGRTEQASNADAYCFEHAVRNAGYQFFNEDGTALGFDDPAIIVKVWERAVNAIEEGYGLHPSKVTAVGSSDRYINDSWCFDVFTNQLGNCITDSGCELELVNIIEDDEAVAPAAWLRPTMYWAIPSGAENKELAAEFIDFFVNETAVYDIAGVDRGLPIDAEVSAYMEPKLQGTDKQAAAHLNWVTTEGSLGDLVVDKTTQCTEVRTLYTDTTASVLHGATTDLEKAAQEFMEKANGILANAGKQ